MYANEAVGVYEAVVALKAKADAVAYDALNAYDALRAYDALAAFKIYDADIALLAQLEVPNKEPVIPAVTINETVISALPTTSNAALDPVLPIAILLLTNKLP